MSEDPQSYPSPDPDGPESGATAGGPEGASSVNTRGVVPRSIIAAGAAWLRPGPHSDVVISSRVRLARNLGDHDFPHRSTSRQREQLLAVCQLTLRGLPPLSEPGASATDLASVQPAASAPTPPKAAPGSSKAARASKTSMPAQGDKPPEPSAEALPAQQYVWVNMHKLGQLDKTLLVERHLISKEHAKGTEPRGLYFTLPDERLAIMVNEEDHLRIQVIRPGLALGQAISQIDQVDDDIEHQLNYAFLPRLGYLTACPTNVGVGARLSVMLHLPGLRLTGDIEKVRRAAKDMSLAVRGYYGENSESVADLYQLSNQTTLGKSEADLRREIEVEIVPQIVDYERKARRDLRDKKRRHLDDHVFRALGLLRSARLLSPEDALANLSLVRLGIVTGLIDDIAEQQATQLMLLTQPAHLQRYLGVELDQQRRREVRADLVRQQLGGN